MERMERRLTRSSADLGGETATLWVLGELITIRASGEAYTLIESSALSGSGMPPHVHYAQDEAIYILEGEYTLVFGDEESRLSPGSFASVLRGTVHALKVAGEGPGRSLAILTPPGGLEQFFESVGVPVVDWNTPFAPPQDAPEMEELVESGRRHGTYLLRRPV